MSQTAQWINYECQILIATVKTAQMLNTVTDDTQKEIEVFTLLSSLGIIYAKKASSCLLRPKVGDTVAFLQKDEKNAYILHILEREENSAELLLPSQTLITQETSQHAKTSLEIQTETCTINAKEHIHLKANELQTLAQKANITAKNLCLLGNTLTTRFQNIRHFCDFMMNNVKNSINFFNKKTEKIETIMEINSKQTRINTDEDFRLRSKSASMIAKKTMTIDADHINIG